MHKEIRLNALKKEFEKTKEKLQKNRGQQDSVRNFLKVAGGLTKGTIIKKRKELEGLIQREVNILTELNAYAAAVQENQRDINDLKGLPNPDKIKLIPFDKKIQLVED
jgi:hypothetical protein